MNYLSLTSRQKDSLNKRIRHGDRRDAKMPGMATPCDEWLGRHDKYGHAKMKLKGKQVSVHRIIASIAYIRLDSKDIVRHTCGNPGCVRLSHLSLNGQSLSAIGRRLANGMNLLTNK